MIYLAAPYTHPDKTVTNKRMETFAIVDAGLISAGEHTVSPLSKHFNTQYAKMNTTWEFWQVYAEELMEACDELCVITMDGWEESPGCRAEIAMARAHKMKIRYLDPTLFTNQGE